MEFTLREYIERSLAMMRKAQSEARNERGGRTRDTKYDTMTPTDAEWIRDGYIFFLTQDINNQKIFNREAIQDYLMRKFMDIECPRSSEENMLYDALTPYLKSPVPGVPKEEFLTPTDIEESLQIRERLMTAIRNRITSCFKNNFKLQAIFYDPNSNELTMEGGFSIPMSELRKAIDHFQLLQHQAQDQTEPVSADTEAILTPVPGPIPTLVSIPYTFPFVDTQPVQYDPQIGIEQEQIKTKPAGLGSLILIFIGYMVLRKK